MNDDDLAAIAAWKQKLADRIEIGRKAAELLAIKSTPATTHTLDGAIHQAVLARLKQAAKQAGRSPRE